MKNKFGAGIFVSHTLKRHGPLRKSHSVEIKQQDRDECRARFFLSAAAQLDLHPVAGDRLECELVWRDGSASVAVDVYAVHPKHPGAYVDVRGFDVLGLDQSQPESIRLRRFA
jgi:hypothetical protein